jgi:hypothetical protein
MNPTLKNIIYAVGFGFMLIRFVSMVSTGDHNSRVERAARISGDAVASVQIGGANYELTRQFEGDAVSLGGAQTRSDVAHFVELARAEYNRKLNIVSP